MASEFFEQQSSTIKHNPADRIEEHEGNPIFGLFFGAVVIPISGLLTFKVGSEIYETFGHQGLLATAGAIGATAACSALRSNNEQ